MKRIILSAVLILLTALAPAGRAAAQGLDPFDPFDLSAPTIDDSKDDEKSANQLMVEAQELFADQRLLDGRTKLLKALKKDPRDYRVHLMLAEYYSINVGHFRLSLKYIKEALRLFESEYGQPPYATDIVKRLHAQLLYVLSQARLDLDDYPGALAVLDQVESYHYNASWYPGSRAWVLMKLGRLDEAIRIARLGILAGAETGRTLNMLGILLSMTGERAQSLTVFKEAINYELGMGSFGQPATPLNNSGEVYKEDFQDDQAETSFIRAIRMPDGCSHVLPSLNLAMLYLDRLNFQGAKRAMDDFESCIAQYPLKNGEEHRALVALIRGRIDAQTGNPESGVARLKSALENTQWFGKIGTNQNDLRAGATLSLAWALDAMASQKAAEAGSVFKRLSSVPERIILAAQSWWLKRRARQTLMNDLSWFEDLEMRHTDSLLEYPRLGDALSGFPEKAATKKLEAQVKKDNRTGASPYYDIYLASIFAANGEMESALALIGNALPRIRPKFDDALKLRALILRMGLIDQDSSQYAADAADVFELSRAELRNQGLPLPVAISGDDAAASGLLEMVGFRPAAKEARYSVIAARRDGQLSLELNGPGLGSPIKISDSDDNNAANRFARDVFSINLK